METQMNSIFEGRGPPKQGQNSNQNSRAPLFGFQVGIETHHHQLSSWWFNPFEKYAQVKLDHFPKDWDEREKYLKPTTRMSQEDRING